MDANNNPVQAPAPVMPGAIPPVSKPAVPQTQMPMPKSSGGSSKAVLWFFVGLLMIGLTVGGIYFLLSKQQTPAPKIQTTVIQVTPSPTPQANLENDLNNINVPSGTNSDFVAVDQDLQQL